MIRRIFFAAATAAILMLGANSAQANPAIDEADALFAARTATTGAAEALAGYESVFDSPDGAEARWKAARALHWLGDQSKGKKSEKVKFFEKGIVLAKESAGAAQNRPEPHFWLAALYGSYGELRGVLKSLSLLRPMREQLAAVNQIDEAYQGGAGHRVLGIIDYKVPGFAGGSRKRALEHLDKAIALGPNNPFNHFYMAEFLVEGGKKDEAVKHLDALDAATVSADVDGPDLASIKEKGAALRKKIKR